MTSIFEPPTPPAFNPSTDPDTAPFPRALVPDNPRDLGLDFDEWRPGQKDIVQKLVDWYYDDTPGAPTRFLLEAPTGTGKSLIAAALLQVIGANQPGGIPWYGVVSTITRNLQTQYVNEALKGLAKSAWGRANHQCLVLPDGGDPSDAPCSFGYKCPVRGDCSYYNERDSAHFGPIAVLNTAFYMTGVNYVDVGEDLQIEERHSTKLFGGADIAIHDEAHLLERGVQNMVEARLWRDFFEAIGSPLPRSNEFGTWMNFLTDTIDQVGDLAKEYSALAKSSAKTGGLPAWPLGKQAVQQHRAMRQFLYGLLPHQPLIEQEKRYVQARAVWGGPFADQYLWRHARKHLLMSATIPFPEYTAETLGIPEHDYEYLSVPSPFPAMARRIVYMPVIKVNAKTTLEEFSTLVRRMDETIDKSHQHARGIVHAVSYQRAKDIVTLSKHRDRMITHGNGRGEKEAAIQRYLHTPDAILVSPSVSVGEDFGRDDGCRFQFFVKWPVPYMGDPVVRARTEQKPESLWYEADMTFIQGVGRGTRSASDWCVNYLLDATGRFRFRHLPDSVRETIIDRSR